MSELNAEEHSWIGYGLRKGDTYEDGSGTNAPHLLFADADYSVGDPSSFIHQNPKYAAEPAIVYIRADALRRAVKRIRQLEENKGGINA